MLKTLLFFFPSLNPPPIVVVQLPTVVELAQLKPTLRGQSPLMMQFSSVCNWWIFTTISCAQNALSLSPIFHRDLFDDNALDDSFFGVDEASLDDTVPSDQTLGLISSDGLLSDSVLDPLTETDSGWLLADNNGDAHGSDATFLLGGNDFACNVDGTANTQLFAKVRRDNNLCRDPSLGQANKPGDSSKKDPFEELTKFAANTDPLSVFPRELTTCPEEYFGTSNIPVCKDLIQGGFTPIQRSSAVNLWFIDPGT